MICYVLMEHDGGGRKKTTMKRVVSILGLLVVSGCTSSESTDDAPHDPGIARIALLSCLSVEVHPEDQDSFRQLCVEEYLEETDGLGQAESPLEVHDGQSYAKCLENCAKGVQQCTAACRDLPSESRGDCHRGCIDGHTSCITTCGSNNRKPPRIWE